MPLGDEFVEVVGLRGGHLAHSEVVEDQQVGADKFPDAPVQVRSGWPPARSSSNPTITSSLATALPWLDRGERVRHGAGRVGDDEASRASVLASLG